MSNHPLYTELKKKFNKSLPGESAHIEMAPLNRPISSEALKNVENCRESAVSIILYPHENKLNSLLIQRPVYEGTHSGQIAFPGGKTEDDAPNALRPAAMYRVTCVSTKSGVCKRTSSSITSVKTSRERCIGQNSRSPRRKISTHSRLRDGDELVCGCSGNKTIGNMTSIDGQRLLQSQLW